MTSAHCVSGVNTPETGVEIKYMWGADKNQDGMGGCEQGTWEAMLVGSEQAEWGAPGNCHRLPGDSLG